MRRLRHARVFLAALLALTLAPALIHTPVARAGGHIGTAMTDFTQVTPADTMIYVAMQSTSVDQPANLRALGKDFQAQPGFASLMRQALRSAGLANTSSTSAINQVLKFLGHLFNGEIGIAVLPATVDTGPNGKPVPHLHLLLEAGLQKKITGVQISDTLALLGLGGKSAGSYHKINIVAYDLNKLGTAGQGLGIPANGPISSTFYAAVAGNDAVLATDLPSLKRAIDTWYGSIPSIAATSAFQTTVSALPADRFLSAYLHFDLQALVQLARALKVSPQTLASLNKSGTYSEAFSVAAESDGILMSASPAVLTGAAAVGTGLSPTAAAEASFLPDDTLVYAAINDPGSLIRRAIEASAAVLQANQVCVTTNGVSKCKPSQQADPIQQINKATGLNLDDDVLSWMHGDASLALLPVGSGTFGAKSPLTRLSLVATMQVSDQGFVEAKLAKISAALTRLGGPSAALALRFADVAGAGGNPLHILAATPNGIGYTFYHGYLILATALPADMAALERGNAGHNLRMNPLYQAALAHIDNRPYGSVLFVNVGHLRQTLEVVAQAMGTDLRSYNQARPLLTAFKSLAVVTYAGPNGGGAIFLGIGR